MNYRSLRILRVVFWLAFFAWGGVCVFLSRQDGAGSGRFSLFIARTIYGLLPQTMQEQVEIAALHALAREFAHFFIHFVLATLSGLAFITTIQNSLAAFVVSFSVSVLIAVGDELVQLLAAGRAFEFLDLGINLIGVVAGSLFSIVIMMFLVKIIPERLLEKTV